MTITYLGQRISGFPLVSEDDDLGALREARLELA